MWWIALVVLASIAVIALIIFLIRAILVPFVSTKYEEKQQRNERQKQEFGQRGEAQVSTLLEDIINAHDGYLLNDFAFKDEQGHTSEIDHILICTAGVFVVETKSNKGVVSGQADDEYWHVRKQEWQKARDPRNPLKQNQGHISHLRRLWGKGAPKMVSMVVFPFANITLVSDLVFDLDTAKDFIEARFDEPKYSREVTIRITNELLSLKDKYGIAHEEHIQRTKDRNRA